MFAISEHYNASAEIRLRFGGSASGFCAGLLYITPMCRTAPCATGPIPWAPISRKPAMSVAFRRESDDEHMEPKFELPIPVGPNLVTPRGARLLAERLAELEAELAALTEEDARKKLLVKIRYFGTQKATAAIQPAPEDDVVGVGTLVTFRLNGKTRSLTIVGHDEADPKQDLIAFTAPLGRAMMQAEVGDLLPFQGNDDAIEILSATADHKVQA